MVLQQRDCIGARSTGEANVDPGDPEFVLTVSVVCPVEVHDVVERRLRGILLADLDKGSILAGTHFCHQSRSYPHASG